MRIALFCLVVSAVFSQCVAARADELYLYTVSGAPPTLYLFHEPSVLTSATTISGSSVTGSGAALTDIFIDPVMNDCPQETGQHTAASCIELDFLGGRSSVQFFPFPFDSQGTFAGTMGTLAITPSLGPEPGSLVLLSTALIALAGIKKTYWFVTGKAAPELLDRTCQNFRVTGEP